MGADFIEFPKLGIHLDISPVAFTLGTIQVRWYGIVIALGIMISLTLAMRQSKRFNLKEDDILDLFLWALPVSIIFARLFFVVFTWDQYKDDLLEIVRIWHGGLAIYGGIIGAVLTAFFFTRARKINTLDLCDFGIVYMPLGQAIGRWGNFFNQELYGTNTDLPWGMTGNRIQAFPDPGINGDIPVHPTFLYESLLNFVVFVILLKIRKNRKVKGSVIASYLVCYSLVRFFMEFLRVDEFGNGNIRYNQVFAAAVFVAGLVWLIYLYRRAQKEDLVEETLPPSPYAEVLETLNQDNETAQSENRANADEAVEMDSDADTDTDADAEHELKTEQEDTENPSAIQKDQKEDEG